MRCRLVLSWAVAAGTIAGFAAAQTSSPAFTKIGGKSSTATKPLTPKSPIATHHAYAASTSLSASSAKTRTELSQVEQQKIKVPSSQPAATAAKKIPPISAAAPSKSGSGIDAPYRPPKATRKN